MARSNKKVEKIALKYIKIYGDLEKLRAIDAIQNDLIFSKCKNKDLILRFVILNI